MLAKVSNGQIIREIRQYFLVVCGVFVFAFGLIGIILPAEVVGGGISGLALVLYYATGGGIPVSNSVFAINAVLLIVAVFTIGWKFSAKTIVAIVLMPIAIGVMQKVLPPDVLGLEGDRLLSSILGGLITGLGTSTCVMQGGSTGGTDIIAMIVTKYRNISFGRVIMLCDFMIIGTSYFIGNDISMIVYSFIVVTVFAYVVDMMIAGAKQSSQIFVISNNHAQIAESIEKELGRGVAILNSDPNNPTNVVMIVCRKYQMNEVLRLIRDIDNSALITVSSVTGVFGPGFENVKMSKKQTKKHIF